MAKRSAFKETAIITGTIALTLSMAFAAGVMRDNNTQTQEQDKGSTQPITETAPLAQDNGPS